MTQACAGACSVPLDFDFTMAFQPVVDVVDRRIYAYEALVRGPEGQPARWVLEKVTADNRYAFDQACRTRAIEMAAGHGIEGRLNINFLPNAVYHPDACLRATLAAAERTGFPIDRITFEFTEDERVMDRAHLAGIVTAYRRYGFQTALDDFGAGYAGLSLLADFQPDILKIDRVLVAGIDTNPARQAIVAGLLVTCERLGIAVVAEGVERVEELRMLAAMGIRRYQGFLFARPVIGVPPTSGDIVFPALEAP